MTAALETTGWEEKTSIDTRPATEFAATVSGERQAIRGDDLPDLFDGDDELEATRVRDVPSSLLKAASDDAPPPTVPTPVLASKSALPTPVEAFEPDPAPSSGVKETSRWRTPETAVALAFFVLSIAVAALVVFYARG
jgi:hypothetical protein